MFNIMPMIFLILLRMNFFDFHHHNPEIKFGIYNLKFGESIPENSFSAGIHPDSIVENMDEKFLWLKEISKNKNCVAIGECGLDGLIQVDEKLQEEFFEKQIFLANEIQKPLIIHCVRRFSQLIPFRKKAKVPMIVHGFNKRKIIGEDLLKHDFYLSFGKSVLHNVNLQDFVKNFPIEKMFFETDSADFEIENLYKKVAELKNLSLEEFNQKITKNLRFLNIPHTK